MSVAIFIDGPLKSETKVLECLLPTFRIMLPRRVTVCECSDVVEEFSIPAGVYVYYLALWNGKYIGEDAIGLYSKSNSPIEILRSLSEWVITDISTDSTIRLSCSSRRAFE